MARKMIFSKTLSEMRDYSREDVKVFEEIVDKISAALAKSIEKENKDASTKNHR